MLRNVAGKMRSAKYKLLLSGVVILVAAIVLAPVFRYVRVYIGMVAWEYRHEHNRERMHDPATFKPVASDLVAICMATEQEVQLHDLPAGWMSPSLKAVGPLRGEISQEEAVLFMQGGFYHYGYYLKRDSEQRAWILYYFDDDTGKEELYRLPLDDKLVGQESTER